MIEHYRPTKAIINLSAIEKNLASFKERLGETDIMAVVKADAYGHGMLEVAQRAVDTGIKLLAVGTPDEALELRNNGFRQKLLVMGASPASFIPVAQQQEISLAAISLDWLHAATTAQNPKLLPLKVHLKVDTGMRRIGVAVEEVDEAVAMIRKHSLAFEGIFTHFATADEEAGKLFERQVERMTEIINHLDDQDIMVHVSNSAATLMHPNLAYDAVRIGISMYGIAPSNYVEEKMPFSLLPAMSLETEIVHIKKVKAGEAISYGGTYCCEQDEWIATLPIGYADGMLRGLQGQDVLIKGVRAEIVGRICMDQCMIRVAEKLPIGEKVQLIGKQGKEEIRINEWADKLNTIPYEIPCILTKRVPRIYV